MLFFLAVRGCVFRVHVITTQLYYIMFCHVPYNANLLVFLIGGLLLGNSWHGYANAAADAKKCALNCQQQQQPQLHQPAAPEAKYPIHTPKNPAAVFQPHEGADTHFPSTGVEQLKKRRLKQNYGTATEQAAAGRGGTGTHFVEAPQSKSSHQRNITHAAPTRPNRTHHTGTLPSKIRNTQVYPGVSRCEPPTVSASILQSVKRGLGHRFIDLAMTVTLASKLNVTRSLLLSEWSHAGEHGGYGFFPQFAGLLSLFRAIPGSAKVTTRTLHNWTLATPADVKMNVTVTAAGSGAAAAAAASACAGGEVVYRACDRCCPLAGGGMCDFLEPLRDLHRMLPPHFEKQPFGASHRFATVRSVLLQRSAQQSSRRKLKVTPIVTHNSTLDEDKCISILAHVRVGDRKLGCDFVNNKTMADLVVHVIQEMDASQCIAVYYMAEAPPSRSCQERISNTTRGCSEVAASFLVAEKDVQESLKLLLAADIVLSGGSSFTRVAGVLSRWALHVVPTRFLALDGELAHAFSPEEEGAVTLALPATASVPAPEPSSSLLPSPSSASSSSMSRSHSGVGRYLCEKVSLRRNTSVCASRA
jgi:hypothetical protein